MARQCEKQEIHDERAYVNLWFMCMISHYLCSRALVHCSYKEFSLHMPLFVSVLSLSGRVLRFKMSFGDMVIDLKQHLKERTGTNCGDQAILMHHDTCHLNNDEFLVNLVEWFVIGDVLSRPALKAMTFELTMYLVIQSKHCANCEVPATKKCGHCRATRYCSQFCQHQHWPVHKLHCR